MEGDLIAKENNKEVKLTGGEHILMLANNYVAMKNNCKVFCGLIR